MIASWLPGIIEVKGRNGWYHLGSISMIKGDEHCWVQFLSTKPRGQAGAMLRGPRDELIKVLQEALDELKK